MRAVCPWCGEGVEVNPRRLADPAAVKHVRSCWVLRMNGHIGSSGGAT